MIGRLKDLTFGIDGKQIVSVVLDDDFRPQYDGLKDKELDVTIEVHRERRSKDANAYFHVLVNKIARLQSLDEDLVKQMLVTSYGALATDGAGDAIGFALPATFKAETLYKYIKIIGEREKNGKLFYVYQVYKETHKLDTAEMSKLIEGTIYEARQLGIETETPQEIRQLMEAYEKRYGKAPADEENGHTEGSQGARA